MCAEHGLGMRARDVEGQYPLGEQVRDVCLEPVVTGDACGQLAQEGGGDVRLGSQVTTRTLRAAPIRTASVGAASAPAIPAAPATARTAPVAVPLCPSRCRVSRTPK
ncbi:hypothetical protein [Streptomyces candidus]|uniref:Uncharacterized protein n=1 Tax=Streptomyces candidus TaxID=67283 RepID=A0A7X0LNV4_9ACTN|nr:hypothetical protein [Streptomyces candidus]MBB6435883.1 hypothetical protein [Streptomyces candidus]GHH42833.1 hypothetical protein GCM10018773_27840 [Streptomyces candidus]